MNNVRGAGLKIKNKRQPQAKTFESKHILSFDLFTHNLPTSETPSNPSWPFGPSLKGFANCQVLTPLA